MLTTIVGILIGIAIGLLLALLQQNFGFISMGNGSFIVDAYPVLIKIADVFLVIITVIAIGLAASWFPSKILIKKFY